VARHPHATPELLLRLVPSTLATEGERAVAMAVLSNPRTPGAGVLSAIRLLSRERVDGSRRENSPWERLAVAALGHPNVPAEAESRQEVFGSIGSPFYSRSYNSIAWPSLLS